MEFDNYSLEDLDEVSETILKLSEGERIFTFFGEMGVGKSTLIKNICAQLGVKKTVTSPTFSIIQEYKSSNNTIVYHFDFYRLNKIEEAFDLGYEDYFHSGNYCFIEWPEKILPLLPETFIKLELLFKKSKRAIKIKKVDNVSK